MVVAHFEHFDAWLPYATNCIRTHIPATFEGAELPPPPPAITVGLGEVETVEVTPSSAAEEVEGLAVLEDVVGATMSEEVAPPMSLGEEVLMSEVEEGETLTEVELAGSGWASTSSNK